MAPPPPNPSAPAGDPPNASPQLRDPTPSDQAGDSAPNTHHSNLNKQQLGFQPPSSSSAMPEPHEPHHIPNRPDGSLPAGGDGFPASENLGFQRELDSGKQPLEHGRFPKISSNYDRPPLAQAMTTPAAQPLAEKQTGSRNPNPAPQATRDAETSRSRDNTAPPPRKDKQPISFADITARRAAKPPDLFTHNHNAIKPVKMNEGLTILMPPQMYEQRLLTFQFALIGRLLLPPGSAPRTPDDIKSELSKLFQVSGDWVFMPLGKGFFSLKFHLPEDQLKASRQSSWKLSAGYLQIREWKPNFDPYKELSSTAQIWVRLYHLPTEYWHPEFLVGIFRAVGNVIKLDGNTAHGLVGHFARALVEIDLSNPLLDSVRVGLPDNLFYVNFSYENVPLLCSFCHFVGHSEDRCRKAKAATSNPGDAPAEKAPSAQKGGKNQNKRWVPVNKEPEQAPPAEKAPPVQNTERTVTKTKPPEQVVHPPQNNKALTTTSQGAVPTRNAFQALQLRDEEDDTVPETPPSPSYFLRDVSDNEDDAIPESPADAMEIVTTYGYQRKTMQDNSKQFQEAKQKVMEHAREIAQRRQLRQELHSSSHTTSDVSIPADLVGQPRSHNIAPNSPHPAYGELTSKLQEATNMGQRPATFEAGPGDSGILKDMENVIQKRWNFFTNPDNNADKEDDTTGDPPDSNPHNSQ